MSDVTTGSAPAAGNPPADGVQAPAPVAEKWYSGVQDNDLRGLAELKGWDTADKAISSYRNLEKHVGLPPERLAKVPEQGDEAGWAEFNKRFGWSAPETAAEYELEVPEGQNAAYADYMREEFKKLGVPKGMAEALVKASNAQLAQMVEAENVAFNNKAQNEMAALKAEWGENSDNLFQLADRAKQEFGSLFDSTTLDLIEDVIGPAMHAKFWANIGSKMGEAMFVTGQLSTNGPMTPEAAHAKLGQLMADKGWMDRYKNGDVRAKQEYTALRDTIARAG